MARCLKDAFGIGLIDTRDEQGRERFHIYSPATLYIGHFMGWYHRFNQLWPIKIKEECCAPDSVSFHYLKNPAIVRHIHSLLYFCD